MRLRFNKQKYLKNLSFAFFMFLAWIIPVALLVIIATGIQTLKVSTDPFKFSTAGDIVLIGLWFGIPLILIPILMVVGQKSNFNQILYSFFVYPIILFCLSLIPLIINPKGKSVSSVQQMVSNTKIFFVCYYILLVLGFILNLFISRSALKKSNWWLFIVALPYSLTGFSVYHFQVDFLKFLSLKNFTYRNVSKMLVDTKYSDIRLINPMWYTTVYLIIISVLLILGVKLSEIIWKKTKRWRTPSQKRKKVKKEK